MLNPREIGLRVVSERLGWMCPAERRGMSHYNKAL
jgi:hypothetical protein